MGIYIFISQTTRPLKLSDNPRPNGSYMRRRYRYGIVSISSLHYTRDPMGTKVLNSFEEFFDVMRNIVKEHLACNYANCLIVSRIWENISPQDSILHWHTLSFKTEPIRNDRPSGSHRPSAIIAPIWSLSPLSRSVLCSVEQLCNVRVEWNYYCSAGQSSSCA